MEFSEILVRYWPALLSGLGVTLSLCGIAWVTSFVIGGALGSIAARSQTLGLAVQAVGAILAGVPPIVFFFWMHYPAQALLRVVIDPFLTAAFSLSILGIFMVADAVRQTLLNFPRQYEVAGRVAGLSQSEVFRSIIFPIVVRSFLPNALTIIVGIFQMSLFSSLISVEEIFRVAQRINSVVYRPVEIYTALALFCIAVSLPLYAVAGVLRARYTRDLSER